jgi:hypothetical protein
MKYLSAFFVSLTISLAWLPTALAQTGDLSQVLQDSENNGIVFSNTCKAKRVDPAGTYSATSQISDGGGLIASRTLTVSPANSMAVVEDEGLDIAKLMLDTTEATVTIIHKVFNLGTGVTYAGDCRILDDVPESGAAIFSGSGSMNIVPSAPPSNIVTPR